MSNSKVEISAVNTADLKTLTEKEADILMKKLKQGDRAAREKFITGNLRLVLSAVGKFRKRTDCADDLFQVGCVGLIKAVDNFDQSQNVRFSTYAVPTVITR
ncbi:MAG: sigma-70 family RNA polymerase sigma factor [Clostridia bacterium]|nr:sigma-70 family RNA polymerase sigma factor [Clostridia bacterium]MBQ3871044.1 sigma-70 family RNA polymerase sigma factor [Clostridia bacterium]